MSGIEVIGGPLTWEEFDELSTSDKSELEKREEAGETVVSEWIYRGLSDANWHLKTSLEVYLNRHCRKNEIEVSLREYYRYMSRIIPEINSRLGQNFRKIQAGELVFNYEERVLEFKLPSIEFMCFARHLGFPSPLLDWTKSPYIAAFFAFKDAEEQGNVAIYAFQPRSGEGGEGCLPTSSIIYQQHPYVHTHTRHYAQQGTYTYCLGKDLRINEPLIKGHECAVQENVGEMRMKKFILRGSEKQKVLAKLFEMNINDYTLFGDEESLMRMLAYKEFREIS